MFVVNYVLHGLYDSKILIMYGLTPEKIVETEDAKLLELLQGIGFQNTLY